MVAHARHPSTHLYVHCGACDAFLLGLYGSGPCMRASTSRNGVRVARWSDCCCELERHEPGSASALRKAHNVTVLARVEAKLRAAWMLRQRCNRIIIRMAEHIVKSSAQLAPCVRVAVS